MKSILITGCNRGLGLGLVKQLMKIPKPPSYLIATCRDIEKAQELREIAESCSNVHLLEIDLKNFDAYKGFAETVTNILQGNGLNVLFNNAGMSPKFTRLGLVKVEQLLDAYITNAAAPVMLTKTLLPLLKKAAKNNPSGHGIEKGVVVNMSSMLGSMELNTTGGLYPYRLSKAALNAASKSMSIDFKDDGVMVTSLHPGWVKTDLGGSNAPMEIEENIVGCFDLPHMLSPLKKIPENPSIINTKFYLFKRNVKFSNPETLNYGDNGLSVRASRINVNNSVKVIIHGYTGSWIDDGPLNTAQKYLELYDCNVIIVDWEKGARGPQYPNAAANTEVIGRQLGILLLHLIDYGLHPNLLHLIGFSLGAHVAGCAAEVVKNEGFLIGRITGLDAASPLFRHSHLRDKSKKLDKDDAVFVDAIHTDASPLFTDGFGLLEPIGHVDFFPNGGFEQPGCSDAKASVLMSHLGTKQGRKFLRNNVRITEKTITRDTACSHLRAWELFLESLEKNRNCEFTAFKCKNGLESFKKGVCFPNMQSGMKSLLNSSYRSDVGKMGDDVQGNGIMYLVTKNQYPFCGAQLQVALSMSKLENDVNVHLTLKQENTTASTTISNVNSENAFGLFAGNNKGFNFKNAIKGYIALSEDGDSKQGKLPQLEMIIDKISIKNMEGRSWSYCKKRTLLRYGENVTILLHPTSC
ncbi:hypothetical protein FQR65_LT12172 [Abscondita terminalis]|nr:hypothetical protein FQR65_LT12172 [Abscondita terminalis]